MAVGQSRTCAGARGSADEMKPYSQLCLPRPVIRICTQRMDDDQLRDLLTRNPRDARRWIEAAAQAGVTPAQVVWGQLLLDGTDVTRDPFAAFAWFERAAASGDMDGWNMVGRCYEQGWGVEPNPERATESFATAAEAGHAWAQFNFAQMLMRRGNPADRPRCFAMFATVAEGGTAKANVKAMNSLARFLEEGWVEPADPKGALHWYARAAALGDHWAQYNLATILHSRGDVAAADHWLQKAIAAGDNGFRRRVAPLLLARREPHLRRHGLDALDRIAAAGKPEDLCAYGLALREVAGPADVEKTEKLFLLAAAKGHPDAMSGVRPSRGTDSVGRLAGLIQSIWHLLSRAPESTPSRSKGVL